MTHAAVSSGKSAVSNVIKHIWSPYLAQEPGCVRISAHGKATGLCAGVLAAQGGSVRSSGVAS